MAWKVVCDNCNEELDPEFPDPRITVVDLPEHQGLVMGRIEMTLHDRSYHLCNDCLVKLVPWFKRP
jgi:hypothetical protein